VNGLSASLYQDGALYTGSNYDGTTQIERRFALHTAIRAGTFVADVSGGTGLTLEALAPRRDRCQNLHH